MLNWEYNADAERRVIREEGVQQGMQQGMQQSAAEIAHKLKRAKVLSNEEISQFTGLSISEVEELR